MRSRFEAQLHELNNEIITMGAMVESAIAAATRALENRDVALATQVAGSDSAVDTKEREIEQLCLKLLLQQPARGIRPAHDLGSHENDHRH